MRNKVVVEKWQIISLLIGFAMISTGLIIVILWQRELVQLKWLQCPEYKIPFA